MNKLETRIKAERAITKALAKAILELGYVPLIDDGGDWHICHTQKAAAEAAMAVDMCGIYAHNQFTGKSFGMFEMVYGNDGFDCICDCSSNELTDKILAKVEPTIAKWESLLC